MGILRNTTGPRETIRASGICAVLMWYHRSARGAMTGEEMERAIQFILQQQAQFWGSIQSLEQIVQNHTTQIGEVTRQISELTRQSGDTTGQIGEITRQSGDITRQIGDITGQMRGLTTQMSGLTDLVLRLERIVEEQ